MSGFALDAVGCGLT